MTMAAPARSVSRIALAAALTFSLVLQPGRAAAQFAPGDYLIRDTEIEEILRKDVTPLFAAAGIDSKNFWRIFSRGRQPRSEASSTSEKHSSRQARHNR